MKVLKQSNPEILRHLGGLQYRTQGKKYRMNKYCLTHEVEEGTLIFNCITGSEVIIRPFELMNIFTTNHCDYAEFLLANYFLVTEDFDEDAIVDFIKNHQRNFITDTYLDHPVKFIILSTTRCNARCFYCYEMNSKGKTHMTYDTAEKVAEYIMNVVPPGAKIEVGWFGGEPLFNSDVIEIITSRLNSAGINFSGNIISNCYLFTDELIQKAKLDWHITNVQVTFDGTEEVYNKIKDYIYDGNTSPYKIVINNVHKLLNNGISVNARMNCDHHNSENLKKLIVELNEEFKNYGNFSMYVWPLFEIGFTRSSEEKEILYKSILEIERMMLDLGYPCSHLLPYGVKGTHCMVDSGNTITIGPKGDIGLCEHYIDKGFISHINNPTEKNFEVIKSWRDYVKPNEFCKGCVVYPVCCKMTKCPDEIPCEEYQRNYWIEHYKLTLECDLKMSKKQEQCECKKEDSCNNPNKN